MFVVKFFLFLVIKDIRECRVNGIDYLLEVFEERVIFYFE